MQHCRKVKIAKKMPQAKEDFSLFIEGSLSFSKTDEPHL